jgi:hypothetical protein
MTASAYKHGFSIEEAMHVMLSLANSQLISTTRRDAEWVFVGFPYQGSGRPIELIAELIPPRTVEVFHLSDLTDHYRYPWRD